MARPLRVQLPYQLTVNRWGVETVVCKTMSV
jgi:hypothetical protein